MKSFEHWQDTSFCSTFKERWYEAVWFRYTYGPRQHSKYARRCNLHADLSRRCYCPLELEGDEEIVRALHVEPEVECRECVGVES